MAIVDNLELWALTFRYYEQLRVVVDMKDSRTWAQASLDAMHSSGFSMSWKTLGYQLRALNAMHNIGLLMSWKPLGQQLRDLDAMHNLGL